MKLCMCGTDTLWFAYDKGARRKHDRWHREWAGGVPLSPQLFPDVTSGVVSVTPQDTLPYNRVVDRLSKMMGRENEHGGLWAAYATWPKGVRLAAYRRDEEAPLAFLALKERRAIGLAIVRQRPVWSRHNVDPALPTQLGIRGPRRPNVDAIFVCHDHRRQGAAEALIRHVAGQHGIPPHELVWLGEFSDAGRRLAYSFAAPDGTFLYA